MARTHHIASLAAAKGDGAGWLTRHRDGWRVRISVDLPLGIGHVVTYEGTVTRPAQHGDGQGAAVGGSGKGWW